MSDTRALLNRIAEFRQRLEAIPRLVPPDVTTPPPPIGLARGPEEAVARKVEAGSRTQSIIEYSLRQLAGTDDAGPTATKLTHRARRLLIEAQSLVTRLRALADDPMLAGPPAGNDGTAPEGDVLAVHYRETAAMTEAAVRYALTFPDLATEQMRLCEGLEGMLDAAQRRLGLLASALERRRVEADRLEVLARFLSALDQADGPIDPSPVEELADALIAEEPGRPLRFLYESPLATQAHLGGESYPAPARYVAAHAINCAKVMARVVRHDLEWRSRPREAVLAALLHDVGMLRVDPAVLAQTTVLTAEQARYVEGHTRYGAEAVATRLPTLDGLAEAVAVHHERADGTGYPAGVKDVKLSPLAKLVAVVDVYAAMAAPRPHRPAADTRTALTDTLLMAERGLLDRSAAETLLSLGFYPAGTVVELADGSAGVVIANRDPRTALPLAGRPILSLMADPNGRPYPTPRYLDLAESETGSVVRALPAPERLKRLARHYPEWV